MACSNRIRSHYLTTLGDCPPHVDNGERKVATVNYPSIGQLVALTSKATCTPQYNNFGSSLSDP